MPSPQARWATTSLYLALRNAFLMGAIGFDVLLAVSVVVEGAGHRWLAPVLALTALATWLAWAGIVDRVPAWTSVWATFAVSTAAACVTSSAESVLLFVSIWMVHLATALPAVLLRGWNAFATHFVGCVGYSVAVAIVHPSWGPVIPQGQVVAGYGIMLALRAGVAVLAELAAGADARAAADEEQFARLAQRRVHGREVAENARILHDTAINTLAAIASGGGATRDLALVRERCAGDHRVLAALRAGAVGDAQRPFAAVDRIGIAVERSGLDETALAAELAGCSPVVRTALDRAAFELVQNAAKHAGTGSVRLEIHTVDGRLEIVIADDGVGFDPDMTPRRGLASSVFARAADAGVEVELRSSPGRGTTVVLRPPRPATASRSGIAESVDADALLAVVRSVRAGAVWLWATGLLLVGLCLELTNLAGRLTPTYGALGLGAVGVVLGWATRRVRTGPVRLLVDGILVGVVVASFALAVATSELGRVEPALWQVLADTGTLVLLRGVGGPHALRVGLVAHLTTGVVLGGVVWPDSGTAALIVVAGAAIGAYFLAGWLRFDRALGAIGRRLAENQRTVLRARVEEDLRVRSEELRESWRRAGLERVEVLLAGLASGELDPGDEQVRQDCGDEEFQLRKLIQLDPELIRLMPWLLQAVGAARERGVDLNVRSGAIEPSDQATVEGIGTTILAAVRSAERGEGVTASLYQLDSGKLSLILVAPHPLFAAAPADLGGAPVSVTTVGGMDMLEARLPV
ncbi:sensor histidine kinase [Nocardioides sp. L-11A]|uniref:sensor histidine kinase n=1 Tax=Nocardioides sp. L-11A TaxID=3043848 RepID=UPI00249A2567|nr:ATP-binding protein [Nocardioides sp. L-11A]